MANINVKVGDEILVKARVVQTGLDYGQMACVVESFEGDIDIEPEQVFIVLPMDIAKVKK